MTGATGREQVTLSRETIHNPKDPRHFMRIKPVAGRARVLRNGRVLAESNQALRLIEAGKDVYDPTIYFPPGDIQAKLAPSDKKTFCPLKGHATYFDLVSDRGDTEVAEIAWSYEDTFDFAAELTNYVAFYGAQVVIEEHPAPTS